MKEDGSASFYIFCDFDTQDLIAYATINCKKVNAMQKYEGKDARFYYSHIN